MSGGNQPNEEEIIVVGDKVDLVTKAGAVHRTMIEDRLDNGPFLAGVPSTKGVHMNVSQEDDLYLVFYRQSGRYIAHMKVVALEKRGGIRYMWLMQQTRAQKNQRREAYRLPVSFEVHIFELPEDVHQGLTFVADEAEAVALEEVSCRDLSVTGIALITKKMYELGDNYLLSLHLERTPASIRNMPIEEKTVPALHLTATVKRCIPWRTTNTFNTGMHFFGMTESMSDGIAKYVLNEQQKQIKKRRRLI